MLNLIVPLGVNPIENPYFDSSPEGLIKRDAKIGISNLIAQALACERFDQEELLKNLVDYANRAATEVFSDSLVKYLDKYFYNPHPVLVGSPVDNPLTQFIKMNFSQQVTAQDLHDLQVPKDFSRLVKLFIGEQGLNFSLLETIHNRSLAGTDIPRLLREVISSYESETGRLNSEKTFNLIKQARDDKWNVGIIIESAQDLYFITLLPTSIRYAVQGLILTKTMKPILDQLKNENISPVDINILQDLDSYFNAKIFSNVHWDYIFNGSAAVSTVQVENTLFTEECAKAQIALRNLRFNSNKDSLREILKQYYKSGSKIEQRIDQLSNKSELNNWMATDIGHAFSDLHYNYDLSDIVERTRLIANYNKSNDYVVILEDDSKQLQQWKKLVTDLSRHNLMPDDKSLCLTPNEIAEHIANPKCKLFLIDLQNGDDDLAGLKVAQKIIDTAIARIRSGEFPLEEYQCYDKAEDRLVSVVIFSHSDKFLKICDKHFDGQIQSSSRGANSAANYISYNLLSRHGGSGPINLTILSKRSYLLPRAVMEG